MYAVFQNVVDLQSDPSFRSSNEEKEDLRPAPMTPSATPPFVGKDAVDENSSLQDDDGQGEEVDSGLPLQISATSPDISNKKANNRHRHHEHYHYSTHRKCSTLPHPRRHPKIKSETSSKSSNPLLDTISVLTYDPCDSDDYYDLTSAYEQRRINSKHEEKNCGNSGHTGLVDGDRDSIGYAGSSSTDSGYKSFCPTPEIPDTSFYGADRGQSSASFIYTDSSLSTTSSQGRAKDGSKAKIVMGTKVINRQGGQVSGMFRDSSSGASTSRRSDTSLYDVNLDHLMYLRQSLLSAIHQCESSRGFSQTSECDGQTSTSSCKPYRKDHHLLHSACSEDSCNHGLSGSKPTRDSDSSFLHSACSEDSCNHGLSGSKSTRDSDSSVSQSNLSPSQSANSTTCSSPSCQKTVRFNTDVKVSTVGSGKSKNAVERTNSSLNDRNHGQRSLRNPQATKSKSILKDPLCANLRSQLESGSADCTLEEEIDSLLYGRAEFYDLESVDEFPCSYVTMIEEKYRSGKPSLAKVRKLKGGKVVECKKRQPAVDTTSSSGAVVESEAECGKETANEEPNSNTRSLTSSAKCRFTEVARCMLEIIEDLQLKKMHLESVGKNSSEKNAGVPSSAVVTDRLHPSGCSALEHRRESGLTASSNDYSLSCADDSCASETKNSTPSNSSYMSASEYHVYEEITYDFVGLNTGGRLQKTQTADIPPPLPARPSALFQKLDHQQASSSTQSSLSSPPQPPCRRDRVSKKTHMFTFGDSSVRDRPKQRSNLYCLFSDQAERRNISRSLEREWRKTCCDNSEGQEDDYGFKRNFPSI